MDHLTALKQPLSQPVYRAECRIPSFLGRLRSTQRTAFIHWYKELFSILPVLKDSYLRRLRSADKGNYVIYY